MGLEGATFHLGLGFQRGRDPLVSPAQGCVVAKGIPFSAQCKAAGRKSPRTLQNCMHKSWRSIRRRWKRAFSWAHSKDSRKKGVLPAEVNIGQFTWTTLSYLFSFPHLDSLHFWWYQELLLEATGIIKGILSHFKFITSTTRRTRWETGTNSTKGFQHALDHFNVLVIWQVLTMSHGKIDIVLQRYKLITSKG